MIWPNQYGNPANPAIHYHQTAPEIRRQRPDVDAVFLATSTGGTLAGIGRYFKAVSPRVRVVAVDVPGSRVFGTVQAPRLLNGVGSSCASQFLRPSDYDDVVIVSDRDAIAACHARPRLGRHRPRGLVRRGRGRLRPVPGRPSRRPPAGVHLRRRPVELPQQHLLATPGWPGSASARPTTWRRWPSTTARLAP